MKNEQINNFIIFYFFTYNNQVIIHPFTSYQLWIRLCFITITICREERCSKTIVININKIARNNLKSTIDFVWKNSL